MLNEGFWDCLLQFVRRFRPCCIVVTPPCSTYSRARHYYKPSPGPRPIRSRQHPLGFPWLKAKDKRKADEGTLLAEKAWELIQIASEVGSRFLAEFPEDLGRTSAGVPASLWQMQQFQDVLALDGVKTFAVKLGPLPESCPHPGTHEALIGMTESGTWKTGPAAHYPGPLCHFLAQAMVKTWLEPSASGVRFCKRHCGFEWGVWNRYNRRTC